MNDHVARKLWALDSPTMTVEGHTLMYGLGGMVTIPSPAFLIEHDKGLVLFDTGFAPDALTDPVGVYGEMLAGAMGLVAAADQRLDRQIEALGFALTDITHVVVSHMHFDHTGGLYLFPHAKIFVGEGELAHAHCPNPAGQIAYIPAELERVKDFDWREVPGADLDLFGDGSLVVLFLPGHTPGTLGLKVRLASQTFILTGDAVHLRAALEMEYHFPIDSDTKSAVRSLRRIKRLRESEDATVWISHDPEDWAEFKHAPDHYS